MYMPENGLFLLQKAFIFGLMCCVFQVSAEFDAMGARGAIDVFKQSFASSNVAAASTDLASFDALIAQANQSAYISDANLASVLASAKSDIDAVRMLLTSPPSQKDINDLEAAHSAYMAGIAENFGLTLAGLQNDSATALDTLTAAVQDLLTLYVNAQSFVELPTTGPAEDSQLTGT